MNEKIIKIHKIGDIEKKNKERKNERKRSEC